MKSRSFGLYLSYGLRCSPISRFLSKSFSAKGRVKSAFVNDAIGYLGQLGLLRGLFFPLQDY